MSNRLKSFALASLVFSLTCGVGLAASDVVVKHTLAQTATSSDGKAEADKLFEEGVQQFRRGEYPKALQTYQRVLEIRRQLGDKAGIGQTLNNIGQVYNGLLQQEKALETLQQALIIRREIKDRAGEGETLDALGGLYFSLEQDEKSLLTLQQALEIRREVKDKVGEAITLSRMGLTYSYLKQQDKGLKLLQQALAMHRELGDKYQEGLTLFRIAGAYGNVHDYPSALDWYSKALAVNREVGNRAWEGRSLQQIGYVYFNKKEYDNALKFFQQSLPLIQEAGIRPFEASIMTSLGDTYFKQENYDKAIELYQQALPIARAVKDKSLEFQILVSLGDSYNKVKNYELALEAYQQALPLARGLKNKLQEGIILFSIGTFYNLLGKPEQAIAPLELSLSIAREVKDKFLEAKILSQIAGVYFNRKQFEQAIEFYQQALALERQPLNNPPVQLEILLQIMGLYNLSAIEAGGKKDYSRAISQANQTLNLVPKALTIAREIKNPSAEKEVLNIQSDAYSSIGYFYLNMKELAKAEEFIQQGLTIARQSGILKAERNALSYLGGVYIAQGYNTKVIEIGQRELEIARILKDPFFEVRALLGLASTYNVLGDYEQGIQLSQQALTKSEEIDIEKVPENLKEYALRSKPDALGLLSLIYTNLGEYDKALEFGQKRLILVQSLKKPKLEVEPLIGLGDVYNHLDEFQKAIGFTQQALKIAKEIKNSNLEAEALKKLSTAYAGKGDYQQALESAQQVLVIAEKTKNSNLKIDALNIQRQIYTNQGNFQKTLELFQEVLSITKQNNDQNSEWTTLIEIGAFYKTLGNEQKSTEYLQEALTLAQKIKNPQFEGVSLFLIAYSYFGKDQPEKIIEYANRGLAILSKTKIISIEIIGNYVLSLGYGELKNEQKAMEAAQASLELARKSKNPSHEKEVLTFIGDLQRKFGKKQEAIQTYNQALAIKTQAKAVGADSGIYAGLGRVYAELNQPNVAITHYKEAINRIEEVRSGIKLLTPDLQASFLESIVDFDNGKIADTYRELAELLITQGRQAEARQVLDLLKIQEIRDFASAKTDTTAKPQLTITESEKKIQTESESIIALSRQISECDRTNCKERSKLNDKLTVVIDEFNQQLKTIDKEIETSLGKDRATLDPKDLGEAANIVRAQPDTVMIYPFVLEDKLWLLLYSGKAAKKFEVKVNRDELGNTVKQFRDLMKECETRAYCGAEDIAKIKPVSQKLYSWLIKPLEGELQENKVKNLVFALDRVTRYIPMSALYDGKQYLIENYTIYNVLSASLTDTTAQLPTNIRDTKVLAMGVSNSVSGFPALSNVPKEVDNIVKSSKDDKGVYPGKEYLNQSFDYKTLRDNLIGNNILHLATHGEFVRDRKDASYLLLGNGEKLAIPEIQTLADLGDIHLVVLSACQTALAAPSQDGIEIASLAYSFLHRKVKSVIASLWQVADSSTSELMQNFYNNLANSKQPITKAEAMRLAQLQLLYNKEITVSDIKRAGGLIPEGLQSSGKKSELETFAHPYYWSPFVLIGNGL
ncbi:MAG: tetratricopeptide repeat protein [Richelia sp. RM1_1_1]|nr:tetratricopeptide repeat protein [Richelia sp. RM1_1_1]